MHAEKTGAKHWYEVTFLVPKMWEEILPGLLEETGFSAMWVDSEKTPPFRSVLRAYLSEKEWALELEEKLKSHLKTVSEICSHGREKGELKIRLIEEEDWASQWLPFFSPIHIGPVWIRPDEKPVTMSKGEAEIILNPGQAFGTGNHETTRLCLEALLGIQTTIKKEAPILDLGTGSGILAMFAATLGFTNILALDVDPVAIETARGNLARNNMKEGAGGPVQLSDVPVSTIQAPFSLIMANLTTPDLLSLATILEERVAPGGWLIVSGVLMTEKDVVREAFCRYALELTGLKEENEWACLVFCKKKK